MNKIKMMNGCKWMAGAALSMWLAAAGSAQAGVVILDNPYNPGEQVVVMFKGCPGTEAQLERLLPLLKQRQTMAPSVAAVAAPAAAPPSIRIAMASPVHTLRFSTPIMVGIGY